jgi:GDP-4-dehydro-6-deoxy-D-mannose reductase
VRPVLVTGAGGFAGSHLVEHLLEQNADVAAWSNPASPPPPSKPHVSWQAVDILDREAVVRTIAGLRPSAIYHCAGIADVGGSWAQPERALKVNALGTHHLLDGVRLAKLDSPVLVTGSALIYRPSLRAIDEDSPIGPNSPYGVSKLAQEMLALSLPSALIARPFNHAGPRQTDAYSTSSFARQIASIEAGLSPAVLQVGNLDSRRDITDVRDIVRAYRLLVERGERCRPYNVCSGTAYRIGDLLDLLVGMARVKVTVRPDPARARPSDNPLVLGDRSRITADTGWAPLISIEQTLSDLLEYWRQRLASPTA